MFPRICKKNLEHFKSFKMWKYMDKQLSTTLEPVRIHTSQITAKVNDANTDRKKIHHRHKCEGKIQSIFTHI